MSSGELSISYDAVEGEVVFDFDKEKETIWATQAEIAKIFGVDRSVVARHLRNIFREGELEESRTCAKNAHVGFEGGRRVVRQISLYNLDAIISVGYRVNSKKATRFRVWATGVIKKYVVDGAAVNERRLKELSGEKLERIEGALLMVKRLMMKTELEEDEAKGILEVIAKYGKAFGEEKRNTKARRGISIGDVQNLVEDLREQTGETGEFGEFKEEGRRRTEDFIERLTAGEEGENVEERAARLLYFVVKGERPFVRGNRRIGAYLFVYFLTVNDVRLSGEGETKISDRALTAIVMLIAESEGAEKELIVDVVRRLLEG